MLARSRSTKKTRRKRVSPLRSVTCPVDLGKYGKAKVKKSDFQIMKVIGRGSYGKVYMVNYIATNEVFAMKSIKKELILKTDQIQGTKGKPPHTQVTLF